MAIIGPPAPACSPPRQLDPEVLGDHIDRLYRAAWALCGSREESEDLVQETFARVLRKPRMLRSEDDLGYCCGFRATHSSIDVVGLSYNQPPERYAFARPRSPPGSTEAASGLLAGCPSRLPPCQPRRIRDPISKETAMVAVGLFVGLEAKPGKEEEVAQFLVRALPLVQQEPQTTAWFALRLAPSRFAIFDTFPDEAGRAAHLAGQVAAALVEQAPELLAAAPRIEKLDVLADKLPG
jgi:quinol monooxygenase YgiN